MRDNMTLSDIRRLKKATIKAVEDFPLYQKLSILSNCMSTARDLRSYRIIRMAKNQIARDAGRAACVQTVGNYNMESLRSPQNPA